MSRTARAVTAFAFGAAFVVGGLTLAIFAGDTAGWLLRASGRHVSAGLLTIVATAFVSGGLLIEGLALHGWIVAPRDDR